ncbi:MAG: zinc ABC transporter substrate-binding protein [Bacteroidales bacterium]|nr:zinc ABC transporter substrate-binding protein [Bacteroidales bacterium]MCF8332966.1 zinc ABC transporter substrate-binding protein [Bacteroidales bacterium]
MRKIVLYILLIAGMMVAGCKSPTNPDKKKVLTVSIMPQKYITGQIAGKNYRVNVLVPPGASPATYEPTPRQLEKLSHSPAYLRVGHIGFEKAWIEKIRDASKNMEVVDCSKGLKLIERNGRVDPHIWTSPEMVIGMARNISKALKKIDPENARQFENNFQTFTKDVRELQEKMHSMLKTNREKSFLIYHPALAYYSREFGVKQIPIETEGKEPSASHMQQIIRTAQNKNIKTVLIQQQFDQSSAKTIAREIDADVVTINPLAENWPETMLDITQKLVKTFKAREDGGN